MRIGWGEGGELGWADSFLFLCSFLLLSFSSGNVQAESDMTGPPVGEGGELVDSDQEDA